MSRARRSKGRQRIGRVSYYLRNGAWHIYYRDRGRQIRRRVGHSEQEASQIAAQINAQLACSIPTPFSFTPVSVPELRRRFLDHHEYALRSSLATVQRYRTATQHLEAFAASLGHAFQAHELPVEEFIHYLRTIRVAPNGHPHSKRRPLRDKGVRFVMEVCRALYGFAGKQRCLPPYAENPFAGLGGKHVKIEDAKPVFVFDEATELAFFKTLDDWAFPVHFMLAKTGLRPGELVHLLAEDLDLEGGWLQIRNRPELGWQIKTRRQRVVPLVEEAVMVLQRVLRGRKAGPVFLRTQFDSRPMSQAAMTRAVQARSAVADNGAALSREQLAAICRRVWREAGAVGANAIRNSFIRGGRTIGLTGVSCPKTWRHTFATLLQDANVDPLVRQLTLGHQPMVGPVVGLGTTSIYTHTRADTHRREIERAIKLWPGSLDFARVWAEGRTAAD